MNKVMGHVAEVENLPPGLSTAVNYTLIIPIFPAHSMCLFWTYCSCLRLTIWHHSWCKLLIICLSVEIGASLVAQW